MQTALTAATKSLFIRIAEEAGNWGGNPWLSVLNLTKEERGNLTHLKRAGLLTTERYEPNKAGSEYVIFTNAGTALATEHGVQL